MSLNMNNNNKSYKNHYVSYNRRSMDDIDNQKNSLAYQVSEAIPFAKENHLPIAPVDIENFCKAGIIRESHTGFKEDENFEIDANGKVTYTIERPKFLKLVKFLKEGYFKGVIFLCWDRASRNKNDDSLLRKLMKQGVDIRFVQAQYDSESSAGELHMDVDSMFAQHYSRVISEKVTNQNRKLRQEGICTYKAPVGYLNEGKAEHKPFDPVRAPIIKAVFEKYAEGTWSLHDLAEWAKEQGLTMYPSRRKRTALEMLSDEEIKLDPICRLITYKHIQRILSNSFYLGMIVDKDSVNGLRVSNSHQALVGRELFTRVQEILKQKRVSIHYTEKLNLPYRGMIRCASCRRIYTPYIQKGITYYGARCEKGCPNTKKSINAKYIEDKVGEAMSKLYYTDQELEEIDRLLKTDLKLLKSKRQKDLEQTERQKSKVREDLAYLRENRLSLLKSTVYSPEDFLQEESKLVTLLQKLQELESASNIAIDEVVKDLVIVSELLKDAYLYYYFALPFEKEELIQKVFSELSLFENTLTYKAKNGFTLLERSKYPVCAPSVWVSELKALHPLLKTSISDLRKFAIKK